MPSILVKRMPKRRGSLYVAVLGVTLIVAMIGMVSIRIARLQLIAVNDHVNLNQARWLAQAAVDFGLGRINLDPVWRTTHVSGIEVAPVLLGTGNLSYRLVDEQDGDLANNSSDPVRLYGIGRSGNSTHILSVLLEPSGTGITSLESALHTGGNLSITDDTTDSNGLLSANGNVTLSNSVVNANVEAVGSISGNSSGSQQTGVPARQMPATSVFDYYVAHGTPIAFSDLPSGKISKTLLTPTFNPFGSGATNPQGIYVIDCQGSSISIEDARIEGTLVLLNAGSASKVDQDIYWEAAIRNFPALLVDGDLEMRWHGYHNLEEARADVNFNPPGAPYQGISDNDKIDEYPPVIKGLIYVSGDLDIRDDVLFEGAIIVGSDFSNIDNLELVYDPSLLDNPPPGFTADGPLKISPGSWRREGI